ncbi:MAG: phosphatase PAP2 family protein [Ginsengibacter sp.]
MKNPILKKLRRVDHSVRNNFSATGYSAPSNIGSIFKWVPLLSVFAFDLGGIKTKNNFKSALAIIGFSEGLLNAIVLPVKKITKRRRPDDFFKYNSFPSGHTATSFMGAEILHEELKEEAPLYSLSGYAFAITTATLRLYKKKHWLSDVIAGAAIGIITARISYSLLRK